MRGVHLGYPPVGVPTALGDSSRTLTSPAITCVMSYAVPGCCGTKADTTNDTGDCGLRPTVQLWMRARGSSFRMRSASRRALSTFFASAIPLRSGESATTPAVMTKGFSFTARFSP